MPRKPLRPRAPETGKQRPKSSRAKRRRKVARVTAAESRAADKLGLDLVGKSKGGILVASKPRPPAGYVVLRDRETKEVVGRLPVDRLGDTEIMGALNRAGVDGTKYLIDTEELDADANREETHGPRIV